MPNRTRTLLAALVLLALAPGAASAEPTLHLEAFRATAAGNTLSFLRTTSWWIEVNGSADAAPLTRLEYFAQRLEGGANRNSGSFDLAAGQRTLAGKVTIRFPRKADHAERLKVRMRLYDAAGGASDWQTVVFPDDARLDDGDAAAPPPPTVAAPRTVEILADDRQSLADVRAALDRAARAGGARVVGEPRIVGSENGMTRFAADVRPDYAALANATPTVAPVQAFATVIGEIFLPDEPLR